MTERKSVSTIILAAGTAQRMGGGGKAFLRAGGQTYLARLVALFGQYSNQVIVALSADDLHNLDADHAALACRFIQGGATRQETIERAFLQCSGSLILVHDVARPLVTAADITALVDCAHYHCAVTLVAPIKARDSLSYVLEDHVLAAVERENLVELKTPQAYHSSTLSDVFSRAKKENWRENSLVPLCRRANIMVKCIQGSEQNLKVTYPEDIMCVESTLRIRDEEG
ncbi:MAG: 2-C-methyl-D-erythritol 4-phosphate cytidylyltransferase [Sneathiella sp.]